MESNHSLFSLNIDPVTKMHLTETARWARFLAIIGFVSLILMVVIIIGALVFVGAQGTPAPMFPGMGVAMAIYYVVIAAIWFIPLLYLWRFAAAMNTALNGNDQQALNTSFLNLKSCFKFVGIVTVILLVLALLGVVAAAIGMMAMGG
ncbi:MAG TPA: DUF5362 family protein [Chitinophagaceae bacterium]